MSQSRPQTEQTGEESASALLPYSFARDHQLLVVANAQGSKLLIGPGADRGMIPETLRSRHRITAYEEINKADFDEALTSLYSGRGLQENIADEMAEDPAESEDLDAALANVEQSADLLASDDDAPVIRLLNSLLSEAVRAGASDIHLEPYEDNISVRLRVDGILTELATLKPRFAPYLVSRIKVMSRLDIAEKRLPQDGRLSLSLAGKVFDVRVSSLPVRFGERIVMRLLDADKAKISFDDLGMDGNIEKAFHKTLNEPNGIILVTGPTGSGKTTTLYAALQLLNDQTRNIMTVEDPVEYALGGISQTQVNTKVGMTFAGGLRAILRQDPDVVMVGEIRDIETAEMAVQASLTGHLVLSTIHTNSAVAAITRLADMGIEHFLLSSSLKGILAQRLVRRLCENCKSSKPASDYEKSQLGRHGDEELFLSHPQGCKDCNHTGYRGRRGIYEFVRIDETLSQLILNGASEKQMADHAFKSSDNLADSAEKLLLKGETSLEEIMRVTRLREDQNARL